MSSSAATQAAELRPEPPATVDWGRPYGESRGPMGREGWIQDGWEFKPNGEIKPGQIAPGVYAQVEAQRESSTGDLQTPAPTGADSAPSPDAPETAPEADAPPVPSSAGPPSEPPVPGGDYDRTPISPEGNFIGEVRPAIRKRLGIFVANKKDAVATLEEYGLLPDGYKRA